ncbi:MAG TPA: phosphoadenylyl-sulfate reductase [Bacteroidales bacterium]|nr:phosphoadenylyl-sulfate reductase [Bacteroidales bacterium]
MTIQEISHLLMGKSIAERLTRLAEIFPDKLIFTTSFGVEDQVITDIIFRNDIPVKVVTLDTGRLFESTYKVFSNTLKVYKKPIRVYSPDRHNIEDLLSRKGPHSFYNSVEERKECCNLRKVKPLERALVGMECWITGIRAGQSGGRTGIQNPELDGKRGIIKYHPLFDWTLKQVEDWLEENHVPYNELHHEGFISIGCEPCTRAVKEGEDFRSGRWWWEDQSGKECGLHSK